MNISLKNDIQSLKSKLENIEQEFNDKLQNIEIKGAKFKNLDGTINDLLSNENSIMILNIGGKLFHTKSSTLLGVKDTLFYKLACQNIENNLKVDQEYFFDRPYKHFPLILDYLRTKTFSLKDLDKYEIDDLLLECQYYVISEIVDKILDLQKEIVIISMDGTSSRYSNAGTHKYEDLNDRSLTKGICVQSPYCIQLEINYEHEIDSINVAGWNGNSGIWYPGNGSNAKIETSIDKSTWVSVGALPSGYTGTITRVKLTPSIAKYIRFSHSSYLGIGYLKLNRPGIESESE